MYFTNLYFNDSLYLSEFDKDAYSVTSISICIIFLLLILFSNGLLIYKNIRNLDFYTRPKNQIIISMAIGDILLALFPLVVHSKTMLGDYLQYLELCRLSMLSDTYLKYLIHSVYGLGICVLGIELMFRNKIHSMATITASKILVSVALSVLPWLLGLMVVLQIHSGNLNLTNCKSAAKNPDLAKAALVISVILPACAAVIICIFIKCCVFSSTHRHQQTVTPLPRTSSSQMQPGNGFTATTARGYDQTQQFPHQPITEEYPLQTYPQQMNNAQDNESHAEQQPMAVTQHSQDEQLTSSMGNNVSNVHREKSILLTIAILFFLLVVPHAIFNLSFNLNPYKTIKLNGVALVTIGDFMFWTMVIRSFVTPFIMYFYSDD